MNPPFRLEAVLYIRILTEIKTVDAFCAAQRLQHRVILTNCGTYEGSLLSSSWGLHLIAQVSRTRSTTQTLFSSRYCR